MRHSFYPFISFRWFGYTLAFFGLLACTEPLQAQLRQFARLSIPNGIGVDASNNVHVGSDHLSGKLITKFDRNGRARQQVRVGNFYSFGYDIRMDLIPSLRTFFGVFPNGDIAVMDPSNNNIRKIGNLKQMRVNTSGMYDVNLGRFRRVANVLPSASQTLYGDVAVHERGNNLYVYITGQTVHFPFVIRLRYYKYAFREAKVIVASSGADRNTSGIPAGIAVNKSGIVLTTMAYARTVSSPGIDAAVSFDYNFTSRRGKPQFILNRRGIVSTGMTADRYGNFYIMTGPRGTALLPQSSGPLVALSKNFDKILFYTQFSTGEGDIAVNSNSSKAYFTNSRNGRVYEIDLNRALPSVNRRSATESIPAVVLHQPTIESETSPTTLDAVSTIEIENSDRNELVLLPTTPAPPPFSSNPVAPLAIKVFPNPAANYLQINSSELPMAGDIYLQIIDGTGRIVLEQQYPHSIGLQERLDISNLPTGIYRIQVLSEETSVVKSFVKQ